MEAVTREALVAWIGKKVGRALGYDEEDQSNADELARYIECIRDEAELRDYMADILNDTTKANAFVRNLQAKRTARPLAVAAAAAAAAAAPTAQAPTTAAVALQASASQPKAAPPKTTSPKAATPKTASKPASKAPAGHADHVEGARVNAPPALWTAPVALDVVASPASDNELVPVLAAPPQPPPPETKRARKSKLVYHPLRGDAAIVGDLLPGRRTCDCMATKHALVNNCLQCGRIVCAQEGMGPCAFCGACVVDSTHQELLAGNSKQSKTFLEKMMRDFHLEGTISMEVFRRSGLESCDPASAEATALSKARRDQLLEYDRNMVQRTRVVDDQADYFNTDANKWKSRAERDAARLREDALRRTQEQERRANRITIDFAGRRIVAAEAEAVDIYAQESKRQEATTPMMVPRATSAEGTQAFLAQRDVAENPGLRKGDLRPRFQLEAALAHSSSDADANLDSRLHPARLQDARLSEMVDEGVCLSMHQPWASLLVYGIKMHEGRGARRGKRGEGADHQDSRGEWMLRRGLTPWMQPVTQEEIHSLEEHHRRLYDRDLPFPSEYPTGCLLGCVDVEDVLPQEEYRARYPRGDSNSPFVFICKNPQVLLVHFPVKGQHKLWKLQRTMHDAARRGLRHVDMAWADDLDGAVGPDAGPRTSDDSEDDDGAHTSSNSLAFG